MMRQLVVVLVLAINTSAVLAEAPLPNQGGGGNAGSVEPWWGEETAGWLGAIVGGSVGLLGAAFGVTAGLGFARHFLPTATLLAACLGAVVLLAGIIAVVTGQPYHVYFLLLLIGGVTSVVFGFNYPIVKRRTEQMELQQMRAMDS